MTRPSIHREAEEELMTAARWYDERSRGLGTQFLAEFEAGMARVVATPEAFGVIDKGVRCFRLHRFPFGILYQCGGDRVYVLAIMHLLREPSYWKHRIEPT